MEYVFPGGHITLKSLRDKDFTWIVTKQNFPLSPVIFQISISCLERENKSHKCDSNTQLLECNFGNRKF